MAIEINLTRGYVAIVDDCDADLAEFHWTALERGHAIYGIRGTSTGTYYLHRVILSRILNKEYKELTRKDICDHINGDGQDNTRANLRLVSSKANSGNMRKHKNSKNPYKGVRKSSNPKKPWNGQAYINGKSKSLGNHTTPELAHRAYCIAALRYWGKFANFGENSPFKGMSIAELYAWRQPENEQLSLKDAA